MIELMRQEDDPEVASTGMYWHHRFLHFFYCPAGPERDYWGPELRRSAVLTEASDEAPNGLGLLKAFLEAILAVYVNHKVRQRPPG